MLSDNIKRIRSDHDLSQEEFAKIAGVSSKAVSTWENGKRVPRMGAIQRISDYFGISKSEIIEEKSVSFFSEETSLVQLFRQLNPEGRAKLLDYADDLVSSGKYIKSNQAEA